MGKELVLAAARYLDLGLSVIALTGKAPNGKVHRHGLKDAISLNPPSDHPMLIATMAGTFNHPDTTGIGILTGGHVIVVDIDGEEGAQQYKELVGVDELIYPTWTARTGRGLHLYFADFVTDRRTRKLGPKLDLKGAGGYVAAPPSRHPDGHLYEWLIEPMDHLWAAPAALMDLLDQQDVHSERALGARASRKRVRHEPLEGGKLWASWGFAGVIKKVREAPEGKRNSVLYWAAYTLCEDGATDEDYSELGQAAVDSGLTEREVRLTLRSAIRAADGD